MARPRTFDESRALDAAIDCFWQRGFSATSVRDLAAEMGINGTSLYNAFGDKRALFVRALETYCERSTRERLKRLEAAHPPKDAIHTFFREIVAKSLGDDDRRGCFLVNSALEVAPHDAELGQRIAAYLAEIASFFRARIRAGQRDGTICAKIDATDTANHFLALLLGLRVLARARPDRAVLEGLVRPALATLEPNPSTPRGTKTTLRAKARAAGVTPGQKTQSPKSPSHKTQSFRAQSKRGAS